MSMFNNKNTPPVPNLTYPSNEAEFIRTMKFLMSDHFVPILDQHIKEEVNRQMKALTATLVAGLVNR